MTEQNPNVRSQGSPLMLALAMAIGALLGASVYVVAELRHAKQMASRSLPLSAAAAETAKHAAVDPAKAPAAELKPAAAKPAEPAPQVAPEAEDPKARALAERMHAEQALLDEARTQLASNNAAAAQATLDRMKKRFARGTLVQERELLRIDVYKARGQLPAAKRAARKFAKSYPGSPHLGEIESLTKI